MLNTVLSTWTYSGGTQWPETLCCQTSVRNEYAQQEGSAGGRRIIKVIDTAIDLSCQRRFSFIVEEVRSNDTCWRDSFSAVTSKPRPLMRHARTPLGRLVNDLEVRDRFHSPIDLQGRV
jgi:hypothetical protein